MVFGHNLRYMAPFDFSRAGFCMVFRRASFVFSCPGADFGARGQIWDPQVDILAWGAFLVIFWVPTSVCEKKHFSNMPLVPTEPNLPP